MSREYARRLVSTWRDKDFVALDIAHQGLYDALSASPDLSRCGVMNWLPSRIARCSEGLTSGRVVKMVGLLVERDFLRLDEAFGELMVRSHVRHDNVLGVPNVSKSMARAYPQILSPYIRDSFIRELARLMVEKPTAPGWSAILKVNYELYAEVRQHPLCEQLGDLNHEH